MRSCLLVVLSSLLGLGLATPSFSQSHFSSRSAPSDVTSGTTEQNSALSGTYVFLLRGIGGNANAAAAGSFFADGNGHVTNGVTDLNLGFGGTVATFTGSYTGLAPNQFSLSLSLPTGSITIPLYLGAMNSGAVATKLRTEVAVGGNTASGVFYLQDPGVVAQASAASGSFVFGLSGGLNAARNSIVGRFDLTGGAAVANGELEDVFQTSSGNTETALASFTGSYSASLQTDRITLGFTGTGVSLGFSLYAVSQDQLILIETDTPASGLPPQSGMVLRQLSTTTKADPEVAKGHGKDVATTYGFTNASIVGSSVYDVQGGTGAAASASVGLLQFDGSGTVTGKLLQRLSGQGVSTTSATSPYTVADNGRLTIGSGSTPGVIGYLTSAGQGFVVTTDNSASAGLIQPQTATGISTTTLSAGQYLFGSTLPQVGGSSMDAGVATFDGQGTITGYVVSDSNSSSTVTNSSVTTYTIDGTGYFTSSIGMSGYLVSATKLLTISPYGSYGVPLDFAQITGESTPPAPIATSTGLSVSTSSAIAGTSITLTASVNPSAATGTVTFYDETSSNGSSSIGSVAVNGGQAILATSSLAVGTHQLTAVYGGNSTYAGSTSAVQNITITPTDSAAVVGTMNPIVAAYTFTLQEPGDVTVLFGSTSVYGFTTSTQHFAAGIPSTIYVAGMLQNTTYHMHAAIAYDNGTSASDPDQTFITGSIPPADVAAYTVTPTNGLTPQPGIELVDLLQGATPGLPFATDLNGNLIWTYLFPDHQSGSILYPLKLQPNGHFIALIAPASQLPLTNPPTANTLNVLREFDLAGNTIRQLSMTDLNTALASAGFNLTLQEFSHDFATLPNGHILVIANTLKEYTNVTGYPGTTNVLGDVVVDLDTNLKPVWIWNEFDHLDVNRHPFMFPDWTHSNAIAYSADDGNFLISVRHQNWIIKVDYKNGAGAGDIIWKLGYQGDFTLQGATDPTDWFYAQHDVNFTSSNTTGSFQVAIMDNGDDRVFPSGVKCGSTGAPPCDYTTAMKMNIDENAKTASFDFHQILPTTLYSAFAGDTRVQPNGDVEYNLAGVGTNSYVFEVTPSTTPQTVWEMFIKGSNTYRAFRMPSLYPGIQW